VVIELFFFALYFFKGYFTAKCIFYRKVREDFSPVLRSANTKFAKFYQQKALRTLRLISLIQNKKNFARFAVNYVQSKTKHLRTLRLN